MAIFGNNSEDLQNNLNVLYDYCNTWGLEVNGDKTKILKRRRLKIDEKWTYTGLNVEVVDSFNYLGTVFKYNGNFALNNDFIIEKALKALKVLLYNCQRYHRIIKYRCTLRQSNNIILIKLYDSGLTDCLLGHTNWVSNVKTLLHDYGFSNVFTTVNSDVLQAFPLLFKQRVIDCFVQE